MDSGLIRKIKKSKFPYYKNSNFVYNINNVGNSILTKRVEVTPFSSIVPVLLEQNSIESNSASQNANFMCSHETVQIELNMSSGEMSYVSKLKRSYEVESEGSFQNSNKVSRTSKRKTAEITIGNSPDELLALDDSLLDKIDLTFEQAPGNRESQKENIVINAVQNKNGENKCYDKTELSSQKIIKDRSSAINSQHMCKHQKLDEKIALQPTVTDGGYGKSPDIFESNREDNEEVDPDNKAWDMSVSVVEEKDTSLTEDNFKNITVSQGLSDLELSTWVLSAVSPPKLKDKTTFEDLLKRTLSSNAHKKFVCHSPRTLSSLSNSKASIDGNLFFGLPSNVKRLIKRFKGISSLYEWQEECLRLPAIEKRKNLVYALPTSGGKTLVAEILVLKEILCREKNVLFVLPYVSIAQEKVRAFSPFAVELGFLVEEYAGSKGAYPPQKRRRKHSVYVATIEKALGLVHSLIECQRIQELGLVVVDELHLIGEPKRGANLESMLTKLMYLKGDVQVIGMSATIGNLADIATFLNADVYTEDFRPVELTEFVKVEEELFKVDRSIQDEIPLVFHSKLSFQYSQEQKQQDPDQIGALVREVVPQHSCLVFCPSKKNCENVAALICGVFERSIVEHKCEEKKALFRALMSEGNGTVCPILRKTLPFGVAYHHSGLTSAERSLLEEAFLAKTICCICCTSTLAAGVNLPARRVILRSPYIGTELLTLSRYKQMIGRAGRTGMGDIGESFLLCRPQDASKVGTLLSSSMDVCDSQLQGTGLACLIISSVDLALTTTVGSLLDMCRCSLLSVQANRLDVDLEDAVNSALNTLTQAGALSRDQDNLALSKIGKAAVKANMDIETAKKLYSDLQLAQDSLVLLSHLHLLYLVTPYTMLDQIHFQQQHFCNAYMELGPKEIQTAKVLGISDRCFAQLMTGRMIKGNLSRTIHRFYLSLILFELWNQNSLWKVSNKFTLPRGLVHNFLISASAFSSSVVRFCEVLDDMWCFKLLLSEMSSRLTHCCTMELLPLMDLPAVKLGRAKQLYNAGFKTLSILAKTEPKTLAQTVDHMPRRVAHQIVAAAKLLLLAKAESLQEEAEEVLECLQNNPS